MREGYKGMKRYIGGQTGGEEGGCGWVLWNSLAFDYFIYERALITGRWRKLIDWGRGVGDGQGWVKEASRDGDGEGVSKGGRGGR